MNKFILILLTLPFWQSSFAQEEYRSYYGGGSLREEGFYNETRHKTGEWKEYYENGELEHITNYKHDRRFGECQEYYENGQLKREGKYRNNKRYGEWRYYSEKGRLQSEGNFSIDVKTGLWKYYHQFGELKEIGIEKDNFKIGKWISFYSNKDTASISFYDEKGLATGQWESWVYGKHTVQQCKSGKKHGVYKLTKIDGSHEEMGYYENGMQSGKWKYYYDNDSLKMVGEFIGDKKNWRMEILS